MTRCSNVSRKYNSGDIYLWTWTKDTSVMLQKKKKKKKKLLQKYRTLCNLPRGRFHFTIIRAKHCRESAQMWLRTFIFAPCRKGARTKEYIECGNFSKLICICQPELNISANHRYLQIVWFTHVILIFTCVMAAKLTWWCFNICKCEPMDVFDTTMFCDEVLARGTR